MGVTTNADKHWDDARQNIRSAITNLHEILIARTWGHDEYTGETTAQMWDAYTTLVELERRLGH